MAAAIPLGVGLVAGGAAAMMGANMALAINIGMLAMTVTQLIMNSRKKPPKMATGDYADIQYTARADNTPLPRVWGTVRLPTHLVWFGNYYKRSTKRKESESRTY